MRQQNTRFPFPSMAGLEVSFRQPLPAHSAALMRTLGVTVLIDAAAPAHCCTVTRATRPDLSDRKPEPTPSVDGSEATSPTEGTGS